VLPCGAVCTDALHPAAWQAKQSFDAVFRSILYVQGFSGLTATVDSVYTNEAAAYKTTIEWRAKVHSEWQSRPGASHPPITFSFTDHLIGRLVSLNLRNLVDDGKLQSPVNLRAQIMRPLELVKATAWFFAQQLSDIKRHREEPPPPLGHMLTEFSQCVPVRVMCGCVATACRRLATAPAGVHVTNRMIWRWAGWMMERVTRGRVNRVQVPLQLRALTLCV
jgi:hypothetical protein